MRIDRSTHGTFLAKIRSLCVWRPIELSQSWHACIHDRAYYIVQDGARTHVPTGGPKFARPAHCFHAPLSILHVPFRDMGYQMDPLHQSIQYRGSTLYGIRKQSLPFDQNSKTEIDIYNFHAQLSILHVPFRVGYQMQMI